MLLGTILRKLDTDADAAVVLTLSVIVPAVSPPSRVFSNWRASNMA